MRYWQDLCSCEGSTSPPTVSAAAVSQSLADLHEDLDKQKSRLLEDSVALEELMHDADTMREKLEHFEEQTHNLKGRLTAAVERRIANVEADLNTLTGKVDDELDQRMLGALRVAIVPMAEHVADKNGDKIVY